MMDGEFENTSQNTQADVKAAGTMLAAPFEIARQETLEEVQQTGVATQEKVAEVSGKIGNYGDTSAEETLFGESKNLDEKVTALAGKTDGLGEYGLDLLHSNKLDFVTLTDPIFSLGEGIQTSYYKKVGQFIFHKTGRIVFKSSLTFRYKSDRTIDSAHLGLFYSRNVINTANLDIGAIVTNAVSSSDEIIDTTIKNTAGEWSEVSTINKKGESMSDVIEVKKGDMFSLFVGCTYGGVSVTGWEIQNATLEAYALE